MTEDESNGPDAIRSIAVHRRDVVTALEATIRTDRHIVLRITPPFAGRMRARIHAVLGPSGEHRGSPRVVGTNADPGGKMADAESTSLPIHVDPRDLIPDPPPYPEVDETTAAYPDADVETRHERHAEQVASWRQTVNTGIAETVQIATSTGTFEIDVVVLGCEVGGTSRGNE